jgi:hypothetical protein
VQRKLGKPVVVNAGSLVTTRDRTSHAGAAGVMIDGFATGLAPADWELDLGRGVDPPGLRRDQGAFVRHFERGLVVVNPSEATVSYTLSGRMYRYVPGPGGTVPDSGKTSFHRNITVGSSVTLGPRQAAVLLH